VIVRAKKGVSGTIYIRALSGGLKTGMTEINRGEAPNNE
jgi:hypothetical protein